MKSKSFAKAIATAGYVGLIPWAPGTFGTVVGVLIAWILSYFGLIAFSVTFALITLIGIWAAEVYEKSSHKHDPKEIVIDEVAGYLLTLFFVPLTWQNLLIAFLIFRFFDILKPWPISVIDREVKGGFGTVLDDLFAGIFGLIIMHLVIARLSFFF